MFAHGNRPSSISRLRSRRSSLKKTLHRSRWHPQVPQPVFSVRKGGSWKISTKDFDTGPSQPSLILDLFLLKHPQKALEEPLEYQVLRFPFRGSSFYEYSARAKGRFQDFQLARATSFLAWQGFCRSCSSREGPYRHANSVTGSEQPRRSLVGEGRLCGLSRNLRLFLASSSQL